MGILQEFNINELAGATGLILGALGGLLAVIWKSPMRTANDANSQQTSDEPRLSKPNDG